MTPERALQIAQATLEHHPDLTPKWWRDKGWESSNGRRLSVAELEEMRVMSDAGMSAASVAAELQVSTRTVERHRAEDQLERQAWLASQVREQNLASFRRDNWDGVAA